MNKMKILLFTYRGTFLSEIPYIPGYGNRIEVEEFIEYNHHNHSEFYHNYVVDVVHYFKKKEIHVVLGEKPKFQTRSQSVYRSSGGSSDDGFVDGMIVGGLIF